ncbi:MAG: FxsA family protein [Acidobacteria bacterium]|nr:FxsA family protein [Acidobacteriota bacterium]
MKLLAKLTLLFTVVTIVETYLLFLIAQYTSFWVSVAMIVFPGMLGAYLARREGRQAFARLKAALRFEQEPTSAVLDGAILLVAAAFLITPGTLTDITALLLMIPAVRRPIREYIKKRVQKAIENQIGSGTAKFFSMPFSMGGTMGNSTFSRQDDNVIDIKPEK